MFDFDIFGRQRDFIRSFDQEGSDTVDIEPDTFDDVSSLAVEALEAALVASKNVSDGETVAVPLSSISSVPDAIALRTEIAALKTNSHHYPLLIEVIPNGEEHAIALFQRVSQRIVSDTVEMSTSSAD